MGKVLNVCVALAEKRGKGMDACTSYSEDYGIGRKLTFYILRFIISAVFVSFFFFFSFFFGSLYLGASQSR